MKIMKVAIMAVVVGTGLLFASGASAGCGSCAVKPAESAEQKVIAQTTCPVMGGKIDKAQYVDHEGARIYVCCKGCIDKIKADPHKYISKLEADGVTLARVPKAKQAVKSPEVRHDDHSGHKH